MPEAAPWKLLLWTALAGLVFGLIGFGEIAEDWLRVARNGFHKHHASGDIVLVDIDDHSLQQVGRWPWPRSYYAALTDRLTAAGARRIFFDVVFQGATDPREDQRFAESLKRSGRVVLAVRPRSGFTPSSSSAGEPLKLLAASSKLAPISVYYNYQNAVWRVPYTQVFSGNPTSSFAATLANRTGVGDFPVDYSIDPRSVPRIPAGKALLGKLDPRAIAGKDVVVGITSEAG